MLVDGEWVGRYADQGLTLNGWYSFGPWEAQAAAGEHTLTVRHTGRGGSPGSVGFKLVVCMEPPQ